MAGDEVRELLGRVTAATGPDRDLDRALCEALGDHNDFLDCPQFGSHYGVAALTSSIDAAVALVAHCRPQARVYMAREPDSYSRAEIVEGRNHSTRLLADVERSDGEAPLAILAALLSALQQDAETTQAGEGQGHAILSTQAHPHE